MKKKNEDPFGESVFIRLELQDNRGFGYNILHDELGKLISLNQHTLESLIELRLLNGNPVWIRAKNISDFSISSPESREYNNHLEKAIKESEKEEEWD